MRRAQIFLWDLGTSFPKRLKARVGNFYKSCVCVSIQLQLPFQRGGGTPDWDPDPFTPLFMHRVPEGADGDEEAPPSRTLTPEVAQAPTPPQKSLQIPQCWLLRSQPSPAFPFPLPCTQVMLSRCPSPCPCWNSGFVGLVALAGH